MVEKHQNLAILRLKQHKIHAKSLQCFSAQGNQFIFQMKLLSTD